MKEILEALQEGGISLEEAIKKLQPELDLGNSKLDLGRRHRLQMPEVVFGAGKSKEQLQGIIQGLEDHQHEVLVTRLEPTTGLELQAEFPHLIWNSDAKALHSAHGQPKIEGHLAILSAGGADLPVLKEAEITARFLGLDVQVYDDIGVAGLHRMTSRLEEIRKCEVALVIAGMDGALPSVLGGLLAQPVIAVPTSVGYGASFNGIAALLSMLNSCAQGLSVVNIDNGFGAAVAAYRIFQQIHKSCVSDTKSRL